jgi:hypothetical protein
MPQFCEDHALPLPEEPQYAVFRRFLELEAPASSRLTAARARADLLARLWPDLAPTHPLVRTTLRRLLQRQADAPLSPRPFWELSDFVERPAVRGLIEADADFTSALADVVANETRRRLLHTASDGVGELLTLVHRVPDPRLHFAILEALRSAVGSIADTDVADATVRALLQGAAEARDALLVEAVLAALPPARRARPTLQALQMSSTGDRDQLADLVLDAAPKLDDPLLVFDVRTARGEPNRGLHDATNIILATPDAHPERLEPILARLDAEARLAWTLETADARIAAWAGARGAEAAEELRLSLDALLDRCLTTPNGGHVLVSRLASLPASALSDEKLLSPSIAAALASNAATLPLANRLVERIALRVVHCLSAGALDSAQRAIWLHLPILQDALSHTSPWTLFGSGGASAWDRDCLPNLARAIAEHVRADPSTTIVWAANLLSRPLDEAGSTNLARAVEDLASILALPADQEGWLVFAARLLVAVRRTGCSTAHQLVEGTFPVLYPRLVSDKLDSTPRELLGRFRGFSWDLAKSWRHWLLDAWLDHTWPPASFLRCMGDDEALFHRIAHRAGHKWRGRDFLKRLRGALGEDPVLMQRWATPVARALDEDASPTDYD